MRYRLMLLMLAAIPLSADKVAVQTLACQTKTMLLKLPEEIKTDYVKLSRYAARHDCVILSESDRIQVTDTDPLGSESLFLRIVIERNGGEYFVPRRAVLIERPGQKNRFRF